MGLSAGLLAWALTHFDLAHFSWSSLRLPWVWLGLATTPIQYVASALRWRFTARRLGLAMPFARALREVYAASFLNVVLPGGIGGELSRVAHHGAGEQRGALGYGRSARIVLIDRLSGQAGLWLLVCVSALAFRPWLVGLLLSGGGLGLAMARAGLRRAAPRRSPWVDELRAVWCTNRAWAGQLTLSLSLNLACMAMFACAGEATSVPVRGSLLWRVAPLLLLSTSLPISVAGFGVREWASAGLFAAAGLDPAAGAVVSVVYGLLSVAGALPGALLLSQLLPEKR